MEAYKSSVALNWRLKKVRYNMLGCVCKNSGKVFFPKRDVCDVCRDNVCLDDKNLSGLGIVESWTIIRSGPTGFAAPYAVGIIKLDDGPSIVGQIIGKPQIGSRVRAVFRKIYENGKDGLIQYGYKFRVVV